MQFSPTTLALAAASCRPYVPQPWIDSRPHRDHGMVDIPDDRPDHRHELPTGQ
jgi:hypothetical protein